MVTEVILRSEEVMRFFFCLGLFLSPSVFLASVFTHKSAVFSEVLQANPELPFDVLLTTYELAMADVTFLSRMRWCYAIVDEAQRLKNANSV
jgi:SNF2 family DNA or RNA helicase